MPWGGDCDGDVRMMGTVKGGFLGRAELYGWLLILSGAQSRCAGLGASVSHVRGPSFLCAKLIKDLINPVINVNYYPNSAVTGSSGVSHLVQSLKPRPSGYLISWSGTPDFHTSSLKITISLMKSRLP